MIEEARAAYLSIVPPQALKARVLAACKAAKKKRAAVRRRMTAAAACLVLIAGLSVYGLSPVPTLSSQGQAMENGVLALTPQTIWVGEATSRGITTYGVQPTALGETVDDCLVLTVDRDVRISVSAGVLYAPDAESATVAEAGTSCQVSAGTELYWHIEEGTENATITVRAALRSVTFRLEAAQDGWQLCKSS